jgi:hypothetical protein
VFSPSYLILTTTLIQAIMNLPEKVGVTATLNIRYRRPCTANQFVFIHTRLISQSGRKATIEAHVEDGHGNVLVEGSSLFVQPKYAKLLHSSVLRKAVGEPPHDGEVTKGEKGEGYSAVVGDVGEKH